MKQHLYQEKAAKKIKVKGEDRARASTYPIEAGANC